MILHDIQADFHKFEQNRQFLQNRQSCNNDRQFKNKLAICQILDNSFLIFLKFPLPIQCRMGSMRRERITSNKK